MTAARRRPWAPTASRVVFAASVSVATLLAGRPRPAFAALSSAERSLVERYVAALAAQRYGAAFGMLSADERKYFGTVGNYASGFAADRLRIGAHRIVASRRTTSGTLVLVSERITFYDFAHLTLGRATVTVPYGIVGTVAPRIKDPYHPWRAVAPGGLCARRAGIAACVRKLAFFTGRCEAIVSFANAGQRGVTLLPYGRSVVRDQAGKVYFPLATRLPSLTDRTLFSGLRLPASGQYTGLMTFVTPPRFGPEALTFSFGPAVLQGGAAPFEIELPRYALAANGR